MMKWMASLVLVVGLQTAYAEQAVAPPEPPASPPANRKPPPPKPTELDRLRAENAKLKAENAKLKAQNERLAADLEKMKKLNEAELAKTKEKSKGLSGAGALK